MTAIASLDFDQMMWNQAVLYSYRPELFFDRFATVASTPSAPDRGTGVTWTIMTDMAAVSTAISEVVDIDAVAIADTQIPATLLEYGNAINTTFKVRATSFVALDPVVANLIGYNAGISLDTIAVNIMKAGNNVTYGGAATSTVTVAAASTLKAADIRKVVALLRGASVPTFNGYYVGVIHPDVSVDLRTETDLAGWRAPNVYSEPARIWNNEVGAFEGVRFMESPRAPVVADAGVGGTVDVYSTLIFGRDAIGKGFSTYEGRGATPTVIVGPIVDKLRRFHPIGWHWFGVYKIIRQAGVRRIESSSSLAVNV